MKRMLCLLLGLSLLLSGCGLWGTGSDMVSPFRFYYRPAATDADFGLGAAPFELRETEGHEGDYRWILEQYFAGPLSADLAAPFPENLELQDVRLEENVLHLSLGKELAALTGVDKTLAAACITLTCLEFPGVHSVSLEINGQDEIHMSRNNLLTVDNSWSLEETSYTLYFSDTANRYLIGESLVLDAERENVAGTLVSRLIDGPNAPGLAETIPVGTALLSLGISDGVCSVNFSRDFLDYAPHSELSQRLTILSVTNTLTQLENVDGVTFYVDGSLLTSYGSMDLRGLMTFEDRAVGPARTGINELDLDLCLPIGGSQTLSRIPVRIQQAINEPVARKLMETLLAYRDQNGYHTPIPAETRLLSLGVMDGCCAVDLSHEFTLGPETDLAIAVISATIIAGTDCRTVRIYSEGQLLAENDWNRQWLTE